MLVGASRYGAIPEDRPGIHAEANYNLTAIASVYLYEALSLLLYCFV